MAFVPSLPSSQIQALRSGAGRASCDYLGAVHKPATGRRRSRSWLAALETSSSPSTKLTIETVQHALVSFIESEEGDEAAFKRLFSPTCEWSSPGADGAGADAIASAVERFRDFFGSPRITCSQVDARSFEWTLSGTWPLPWRPRVSVSGRSDFEFADDNSCVTKVVDQWDASPSAVFRSSWPRWEDLVWLYVSPHSENLDTRTLIEERKRNYRIVTEAARQELVSTPGTTTSPYVVPVLPDESFTGTVRRAENWSPVRPVFVSEREPGKCEIRLPVPTKFEGKLADTDSFIFENVPRRKFAVKRFAGFFNDTVFKKNAEEFAEQLRSDGFNVATADARYAFFNGKIGFNEDGELAIACYYTTALERRRNEISFLIKD